MNRCSICLKENLKEDAPVLTISGYGIPRCLCDECAEKINILTYGKDVDAISEASRDITAEVAEKSVDDTIVYDAVTEILEYAADRVAKIKNGTWDFSLDEENGIEAVEELPEELLESEEDRLLDEKEAEQNKKIDKVLNWVYPIVFAILAVLAVYFMVFR